MSSDGILQTVGNLFLLEYTYILIVRIYYLTKRPKTTLRKRYRHTKLAEGAWNNIENQYLQCNSQEFFQITNCQSILVSKSAINRPHVLDN